MKKSDLKNVIKPLVKECINEILIEEGLLSNVVSEVVKGISVQPIVEHRAPPLPQPMPRRNNAKATEQRQKLMAAINKDAYNGIDLFEGTQPMSSYEAQDASPGGTDLGNPNDAGVDISSLVGGTSKIWEKMK